MKKILLISVFVGLAIGLNAQSFTFDNFHEDMKFREQIKVAESIFQSFEYSGSIFKENKEANIHLVFSDLEDQCSCTYIAGEENGAMYLYINHVKAADKQKFSKILQSAWDVVRNEDALASIIE